MSKTYIALQALQFVNADGARIAIEPRQEGKSSGLFEHEFDKNTEAKLLSRGAIRLPEGTEEHEEPTKQEELLDSRELDEKPADDKKVADKAPKTPAKQSAEKPADDLEV